MKTCTKCKIEKTPEDFYPSKHTADKLSCYCKDCQKSEAKKSYLKRKEAKNA